VQLATPSIICSPLPLKVSDPCDEILEHSPQLLIEYLIPLCIGAKPLPFLSIFHTG